MSDISEYMRGRAIDNAMGDVGQPPAITTEPYYGQKDPDITDLIKDREELKGFLIFFSNLHRTANYDWNQAKRMEILLDTMITEHRMWYSNRPDILMFLEHIRIGGHQIIWGDAYLGARQKYLQTNRQSIELKDMTEKKKRGLFW